jgi:hypothetical protein
MKNEVRLQQKFHFEFEWMLEIDFFSGPFAFLSICYVDQVHFRRVDYPSALDALKDWLNETSSWDIPQLFDVLRAILYDRFMRNPDSLRNLCETVARPLIWELSEINDESSEIEETISSDVLIAMGKDGEEGYNLLGKTLMEIRQYATTERYSDTLSVNSASLVPNWLKYSLGMHEVCKLDVLVERDSESSVFNMERPFILVGSLPAVCDVYFKDDILEPIHCAFSVDSLESSRLMVVQVNKSGPSTEIEKDDSVFSLVPLQPFACELTSVNEVRIHLGGTNYRVVVRRPDFRILNELEERLTKSLKSNTISLYIGNLPDNSTERDIEEIMDPNGILRIDMIPTKKCAFVEVKDTKWLDRYLISNGVKYRGNRIAIRRKK